MCSAPGLNAVRLVNLMRAGIERCQLDLSDTIVLTEAASGAYVVTPVLAAMANAKHVYAMTRSTRHGSVENITTHTSALARLAEVGDRIEIVTTLSPDIVGKADIITNSGHLRPIDAEMVSWMQPTAVVALMFESWEFRHGDFDLDATRQRGIRVVGTNERHPSVDVFSFLGIMAVKLLADAAVAAYQSRIAVFCDNPFAPYIQRGLVACGSVVQTYPTITAEALEKDAWDAILVAMRPTAAPVVGPREARLIAGHRPGAVVVQFWGDLDRAALDMLRVPYWPREAPTPGHMGILPSGVGPEAIVRLQAGSLKAAEVTWRGSCSVAEREFADAI